MKRFVLLLMMMMLLTACAPVNVPPADYDEPSADTTESETVTEYSTMPETTTAPRPSASKEQKTSGSDHEEKTETETEPIVIPDWAEAYAALIRQKNADSGHEESAYAMIRLDADEIPELVILDDLTAELYYYNENAPVLLLEDDYKSPAVTGQNFCYQPETGKVASYFSTMGGGSGFNFFFYDTLDSRQSVRFCFNNYESEDGDMPYNPIWDRAEEFDVLLDDDLRVSLGKSWTHIGTGFNDIHKLVAVTGNKLAMEWNGILDGIHEPDELETEEQE